MGKGIIAGTKLVKISLSFAHVPSIPHRRPLTLPEFLAVRYAVNYLY